MACGKRDADLAVVLHPADTGSMAGARIEDDEGSLARIDLDAGGRHDANQAIVDRARQLQPAHDQLEVEIEHVWRVLRLVREMIVAALTHDVEEENRTLPSI